jgi:deoxyribodipyrimidine photolyase-like uncharacterized protein
MKLLRRFCSEQVRILLARMDAHWEAEFDLHESKWNPMLPDGRAFSEYTWIERRCISFTAKKQEVKLRRERAYVGILERTISPTKTRWEFDDEVRRTEKQITTGYTQPSYMLTSTAMVKQMEAMLGNQYYQELQKSILRGSSQ